MQRSEKRQRKMLGQDEVQNIASILSRDRVAPLKGWKTLLAWRQKLSAFLSSLVLQNLISISS